MIGLSKAAPTMKRMIFLSRFPLIALALLSAGCSKPGPDIELNGVTLFDVPLSFYFTNREQQPITIERVVVNGDTELLYVITGPRKATFSPTVLQTGESIALNNTVGPAARSVTAYTDRGSRTWEVE